MKGCFAQAYQKPETPDSPARFRFQIARAFVVLAARTIGNGVKRKKTDGFPCLLSPDICLLMKKPDRT